MKESWWKEGVVYQVYPRSFNDSTGNGVGDIKGIIQKLDYIKSLGVTIIWLNPVYKSPNDDNGYDISNYMEIMDEFGTMEDWEELLSELHKRDLKLIMDLVVNHCSDEHEWFIDAKKSKESKYRDYFYWKDGTDGKEPNNWCSVFGGSVWEKNPETDDYFLHLFSKKQPELNWSSKNLRFEIYNMMKWWLDKGIDGFRMDVINMISKNCDLPSVSGGNKYEWGGEHFMNGPKLHDYIKEMNREVLSKYDCLTVGECFGTKPEDGLKLVDEDRNELNMIFQMEHMDLDSEHGKWNYIPWELKELKSVINRWYEALKERGWNSQFWMNHDQPRAVSRFGDDYMYRNESAKMLAGFILTLQGTPYIYQGEEIGMTNINFNNIEDYRDLETLNYYKEAIENGEDLDAVMASIKMKSRDNSRTPMQWDSSENAGFTNGEPWIKLNPNYQNINVESALRDKESIFYFYQDFIKYRKENKCLIYGDYIPFLEDDDKIYAYFREYKNESFIVIINFFDKVENRKLKLDIHFGEYKLVKSNYEILHDMRLTKNIELRPYEFLLYKKS